MTNRKEDFGSQSRKSTDTKSLIYENSLYIMPGVDDAIVVRGPLEKNFKIGGLQR